MTSKIKLNETIVYLSDLDIYTSTCENIEFYENDYLNMNPDMHKDDSESKFHTIKEVLKYIILDTQVESIADIGCGSCVVLKKLLDYIKQENNNNNIYAVGIDVSKTILLNGIKSHNIIKLRANCEDIPLESKSITISFCIDILEHVNNPILALKEVSRLSKFVIFKIPLELSLYTILKGWNYRLKKMEREFGHIHHFNRRDVFKLIQPFFYVKNIFYQKIPNRNVLFDYFQNFLLKYKLYSLFSCIWGGFIIIVGESKN